MRSRYEELKSYFDAIAFDFRSNLESYKRAEQIFRLLNPCRVEVALDVGCGNGFLFPVLKKYANFIVGVDISTGMLRCARSKFGCRYLINSYAEILPLRDESVDMVLNYCVLPHIERRMEAYREFRRVLKPGGRFYVIHPEGRERTNQIHMEIGEPVKEDLLPEGTVLIEELRRAKFRIVNYIDVRDLFMVEAEKRSL